MITAQSTKTPLLAEIYVDINVKGLNIVLREIHTAKTGYMF
jgi:hypothetical protein